MGIKKKYKGNDGYGKSSLEILYVYIRIKKRKNKNKNNNKETYIRKQIFEFIYT